MGTREADSPHGAMPRMRQTSAMVVISQQFESDPESAKGPAAGPPIFQELRFARVPQNGCPTS